MEIERLKKLAEKQGYEWVVVQSQTSFLVLNETGAILRCARDTVPYYIPPDITPEPAPPTLKSAKDILNNAEKVFVKRKGEPMFQELSANELENIA